eukprot:673370-Hanusia_phi.AAC.1
MLVHPWLASLPSPGARRLHSSSDSLHPFPLLLSLPPPPPPPPPPSMSEPCRLLAPPPASRPECPIGS